MNLDLLEGKIKKFIYKHEEGDFAGFVTTLTAFNAIICFGAGFFNIAFSNEGFLHSIIKLSYIFVGSSIALFAITFLIRLIRKKETKSKVLLFIKSAIIVGLALLIILPFGNIPYSFKNTMDLQKLKERGVHTTGEIVKQNVTKWARGSKYGPVVDTDAFYQYEYTVSGKKYTGFVDDHALPKQIKDDIENRWVKYTDEHVYMDIYYLPENPEINHIGIPGKIDFAGAIFGIVYLYASIICFALWGIGFWFLLEERVDV